MKKLKIEIFNEKNEVVKTVTAKHLDASRHLTLISISESNSFDESQMIRLLETLEHINIYEGLVTLYYTNGYFMEISRTY